MGFFVTFLKMRLFPLISYMQKRTLLFILLSYLTSVSMTSCVPTKMTSYFTTIPKDTTLKGFITDNFETRIQKKDVIAVNVSSLNKEMDMIFNGAAAGINESASTGGLASTGYTVDDKGNILIHMLGSIHVEGLTRNELKLKLQQDLLPYMKEPIVSVLYLNHKVTVIGYVVTPQVLNMPGEQMPLLDVLVSSGDMKDGAKKNDIMIIRENGTEKLIKHINLEDHSLFNSPWYYVQSNDIVYVIPDKVKADKEERRRNTQATVAIVVSVLSLVIIMINSFVQ
jgi:polysaccharide export outer membrane protein